MGLSTYSIFKKMGLHNPDLYVLSNADIKEVQKVLLTIMDDIHDCCIHEGFQYAFCGGGAIGVIRHGGFIPWDDDLDIAMPRADYDRFREAFLKSYGDRYWVQEIRASEKYDLNFMKVRLKGSKFCEILDPDPEEAGFFIDILPVENVYENKWKRNWQWLMSDGMQFICSCMRIRKKRKKLLSMAGDYEEAISAIKKKSLIALPFSIISFRRWLLWTEKALAMNKDGNTALVSIPTGGLHFKGDMYPRADLFPAQEETFAGHTYCFFHDQDAYLTHRYGDYMTPPPEGEHEKHVLAEYQLPAQH